MKLDLHTIYCVVWVIAVVAGNVLAFKKLRLAENRAIVGAALLEAFLALPVLLKLIG